MRKIELTDEQVAVLRQALLDAMDFYSTASANLRADRTLPGWVAMNASHSLKARGDALTPIYGLLFMEGEDEED